MKADSALALIGETPLVTLGRLKTALSLGG